MGKYRLAWATDIHLEFCDDAGIDAFVNAITSAAPDGLVLTGDIGQAPTVARFLSRLEGGTSCPIYFVLGNHDFYKGSIAAVHAELRDAPTSDRLRWLRASNAISLTPKSALVGVDGWADGRLGDYANSDVMLNDFILIRELSGISAEERLVRMQRMADEDAAILVRQLQPALRAHERVIVATHVPPFAAAAWHEGKQSDDNWLPHFSCKAVGDVLLEAAEGHRDREMLVLCGHTHGGGTIRPLPNLRVITGPAEYGAPGLQAVFDLD